jgi:hypothetical protein
LPVLLAAGCFAIVAGVAAYRARSTSPPALLARLPQDGAVVVSIDFGALRKAGLLGIFATSKVAQDPEYRAFVEQTAFDYINDLDSALISFHSSGTYLVLRGRFDWKAVEEYAERQGGQCHNTFCLGLAGSAPDRKISFFPLRRDVMGLAVSEDEYAAGALQTARPPSADPMPSGAIWCRVPLSQIRNRAGLPPAATAFAAALEGADSVLIAAAPSGKRIALRLDAACASPAAASALVTRLRDLTAHLRDGAVTPDPKSLGGVLSAGAFERKESHAIGRWPIEREFLESLAGGAF